MLVAEAYRTLSDDLARESYDRTLRTSEKRGAMSRWSPKALEQGRGLFVDETKCTRCYLCIIECPSTFRVHDAPERL
eukprot:8992847-Pyramimonas_sp.AAC.1